MILPWTEGVAKVMDDRKHGGPKAAPVTVDDRGGEEGALAMKVFLS